MLRFKATYSEEMNLLAEYCLPQKDFLLLTVHGGRRRM